MFDEVTLIVTRPLWTLSPELLAELRQKPQNYVPAGYDTFLLDPGMGPTIFLTADGRILWEDDGWGVKGTLGEVLGAILVGSRKTGIQRMLELLPARPSSAVQCAACQDGIMPLGNFTFICGECGGLGWKDPSVDLEASVL